MKRKVCKIKQYGGKVVYMRKGAIRGVRRDVVRGEEYEQKLNKAGCVACMERQGNVFMREG